MSIVSMPTSKKERPIKGIDRKSLIVAVLPTALVVMTLFAGYIDAPFNTRLSLFFILAISVFGLLFRLYRTTKRSKYAEKLADMRIHMLAHFVPFVFFLAYLFGITSSWINLALILLLILFFASGRTAWRTLGNLFPSTDIYKFFYRGNSAFMTSFPILYLASLFLSNVVSFALIQKVALFYFSIHFIILGISCLKIESDLRSEP